MATQGTEEPWDEIIAAPPLQSSPPTYSYHDKQGNSFGYEENGMESFSLDHLSNRMVYNSGNSDEIDDSNVMPSQRRVMSTSRPWMNKSNEEPFYMTSENACHDDRGDITLSQLPNRWSQFDSENQTSEQHAATAEAVYLAATALADRETTISFTNSPKKINFDATFNRGPDDSVDYDDESLPLPIITSNTGMIRRRDSDDEYYKAVQPSLRPGSCTPTTSSKPESSNSSVGSTNSSASAGMFVVDHQQIRQEALRMLEVADADQHYDVYKTLSGGYSATAKDKSKKTTYRTALAGIGLSSSLRLNRSNRQETKKLSSGTLPLSSSYYQTNMEYGYSGSRGNIGIGNTRSEDDEDEDDASSPYDGNVVDVAAMERRALANRESSRRNINDDGTSVDNTTKPSWSSRYSIDNTLLAMTGGTVSKSSVSAMRTYNDPYSTNTARILERMDSESRDRQLNQAGGLWNTCAFWKNYNKLDTTNSALLPSTRQPNLQLAILELEGSSLPPANPRSKSWNQQLQKRRQQCQTRSLLIFGTILVIIIIVMGSALIVRYKEHHRNPVSNAATIPTTSQEPNYGDSQQNQLESVTFYVMSDVPFKVTDDKRLEVDLQQVSEQAKFFVHLGNTQVPGSDCPVERYDQVAKLLTKSSPKPVYAVPGTTDWNTCPDRDAAWAAWYKSFAFLHEQFPAANNPEIYHQKDYLENWAFVSSGVLLVGIHEVGGPITSVEEFKARNEANFRWVMGMVNEHWDEIRALVIFGNFRPGTTQTSGLFGPLGDYLSSDPVVNVLPTLYVHSPSSGRDDATAKSAITGLHRPFRNVPNLYAFSPPVNSSSLLYRINVGFNTTNPFIFG